MITQNLTNVDLATHPSNVIQNGYCNHLPHSVFLEDFNNYVNNSYRLITADLLLRVNLDKIMHAR